MARLGYARYGTHGGDIGAGISGRLGATDATHVVGTLVVTDPGSLGLAGEQFPIPDHLTEEERARVEQERTTWRAERGTSICRAIALDDRGSPHRLTGRPACLDCREVPDLDQPGIEDPGRGSGPRSDADQRQPLLVHPERRQRRPFLVGGRALRPRLDCASGVPSGWVVFNTEPIMRRFMDPQHQMAYWSEHTEGGHFPAMEEPALLVDDLRSFFRDLR